MSGIDNATLLRKLEEIRDELMDSTRNTGLRLGNAIDLLEALIEEVDK